MTGSIRLDMPSSPRYVSLARLIAGSLARGLNFSEEGVDDLKIVISEMCTNAIIHCGPTTDEADRVSVEYIPGQDSITIEVTGPRAGLRPRSAWVISRHGLEAGKGFGLPLIKSLVDEFELQTDKDRGTTIRVTKYERPEPGPA